MQIVTDMEEGAAAAFIDQPLPRNSSSDPLPGEIRELASFFFPEIRPRCLSLDVPEGFGRFETLLLLDNSSRSNLDLVMEAHRRGVTMPDGIVFAARRGRGFMGRFDRSWACLDGNLHVVLHLKPRLALEQAGAAFSILPAVACAEAIRLEARLEAPRSAMPRIKWINDLVVGGRKIAGMLTRQSFQDPLITDVFLGIGINVLRDPGLDGNPFVPATGCLADRYRQRKWTPGRLLARLLTRVDHLYGELLRGGPGTLLDLYRQHDCVTGRRVRVYADGFGFGESEVSGRRLIASGVVEEILDDLSLRIDGKKVNSGRLAFEDDCRDHPLA